MSDENAIGGPDIVTEALSAGTFSFAEVVQGRGYPQDTVVLYQDEATAYERAKYLDSVLEARGDNSHEMLNLGTKQDEAKRAAWKRAIEDDPEVAKKVAEYDATLAKSAYTFHIQGIPNDMFQTLGEKADADRPPTIEKWKNPLDGRQMKSEVPHPDRNRHFAHLLWAAHITKIVDAEGRADTAPGLAAAEAISKMPLSQQEKFAAAINGLQVAASSFESAASDPDFS
jgi:hypothetical protein